MSIVFHVLCKYYFNIRHQTSHSPDDIECSHKILIGTNKEIELFNVRPSFVSGPLQQR